MVKTLFFIFLGLGLSCASDPMRLDTSKNTNDLLTTAEKCIRHDDIDYCVSVGMIGDVKSIVVISNEMDTVFIHEMELPESRIA